MMPTSQPIMALAFAANNSDSGCLWQFLCCFDAISENVGVHWHPRGHRGKLRAGLFKICVTTVLPHASECWVAKPGVVLGELRRLNWEFAAKPGSSKVSGNSAGYFSRVKKMGREINAPGSFLGRVLGCHGNLLHTDVDVPPKDVFHKKKGLFLPWFFGVDWETARKWAKQPLVWSKFVEISAERFALPKKQMKKKQ
jgi:hypothetical protein